ncbi:MAG: hypothetical protein IJ480_06290 [Clostridia bacterium]|nr:hypothetical protein [Clostridia bacterium]
MRKITASLLLFAMLLSAAACGQTEAVNDTAETDAAVIQTDTAAETEETRAMHQVPETDFEGANFHILYPTWQGYQYYFFADEETGDAMNDAIFTRTIRVEEYLNVDITQEDVGGVQQEQINQMAAAIKKTVTAGDDVYDMTLLHCISAVSDMVTTGMLYNLDDLPYINMEADWWNREQMDVLRLGQNTYYGVSDYMIPCPYAVFFNKGMIEDNGMANPYELVYEGKWTMDTMMDMAVEITRDLNGDGTHTEDADIYGISATETSKYASFTIGCGQFITSRTEDGRIFLDCNTEKMYSIVETMHKAANNPGTIFLPAAEPEINQFDFDSGRLLFRLDTIANAVLFRDYESDIGILPYPKFDEAQKEYISMDWGGLMCVPVTIQETDMVGAVLELLAYESGDTVIPAYYDVLLAGKLSRDEDSRNMIDILFDTIAYEVGCNYFGFTAGFNNMLFAMNMLVIDQKSTDFASWYASYEKQAVQAIDKLYAALDKVEN